MVAPIVLNHGKDKWTITDKAVRTWLYVRQLARRELRPARRSDQGPGRGRRAVDEDRPEGGFGDVLHEQGWIGRRGDARQGRPQARRPRHRGRDPGSPERSRRRRQGPAAPIVPALAVIQPQLTHRPGGQGRPADEARSRPGRRTSESAPTTASARTSRSRRWPSTATSSRPGETFCFWKAVGAVTPAKGYSSAARSSTATPSRGRARRRDLLLLDHAVQCRPSRRPPDGRSARTTTTTSTAIRWVSTPRSSRAAAARDQT